MNKALSDKKVFVAMRHEQSIAVVWGFVSGHGMLPENFRYAVMERHADTPEDFEGKKTMIFQGIRDDSFDALVLATKINDTGKDSALLPFLEELKAHGIAQKPIVLTHLEVFGADRRAVFNALGMNLFIVEGDNLGMPKPKDTPETRRTGMSQLGPVIFQALNIK